LSKYCSECGAKKSEDKVFIHFLLDRSGSMEFIKDATIEGFNAFLDAQQELTVPVTVSLTLFDKPYNKDTQLEKIWDNIPVAQAQKLTPATFRPRGDTPLYDAITRTIAEVDAIPDRGRTLFVIQTDGQENASTEANRQQVFDLINRKRSEGWEFVFLGANQDAYAVGAGLGIARGSTMSYTGTNQGTLKASGIRNSAIRSFAGGQSASGNFFGNV
jgi:hypothetical protein